MKFGSLLWLCIFKFCFSKEAIKFKQLKLWYPRDVFAGGAASAPFAADRYLFIEPGKRSSCLATLPRCRRDFTAVCMARFSASALVSPHRY